MAVVITASFAAIAAALFVAELTDKDAFLLIAVATKVRPLVVFAAGATAFTITTALFVTAGSFLVRVVPVEWVRLAGGFVMIGYALWESRGLVGLRSVREDESMVEKPQAPLRAFITLVAALAVLDIAGDATEILTIVFVSQYSDPVLVFSAALTGLVAATAFETALGSRLGALLTPKRLQYVSVAVFFALGAAILALGFF